MRDWIAEERRYLFQNYVRQPVVLVRGRGTRVWDDEGREYLDFVGGIAVNVLGHAHPAVVEAVRRQAAELVHVSNLYYSTPMVELARLLVEVSGLDRVFFCNSGAEAVEAAIKLARRWGRDARGGAFEIIAAEDAFHGRTLGALAATGTARYREPFEPLPPGFVHVPWNDVAAIRAATTANTVAVLLEPIQGEAGVKLPQAGFLRAVREWCDEKGLLLILDEIQTGMGRTGTFFAFEQEGVRPDVVCLAKGLAGGVPIGAVLAREEVARHFVPGDHGSTFGGNPLACAAGVATVRAILEQGLPNRAARLGEWLLSRLRQLEDRLPVVSEVRGRGLMVAIQLARDVAGALATRCRERGLLVNNVRPDAIRLLPPLTVTEEELERACDILAAALGEVELDG